MKLLYKSDFEESRRRWEAFWQRGIIDRPVVGIIAPKDGAKEAPNVGRTDAWGGDYEAVVDRFERFAETHIFVGDRIPSLRPGFGPDQFAGFLGAELVLGEGEDTSWAKPFVTDWDNVLPFRLNPDNPWWKRILEITQVFRKRAEGRFLIAHIDLHSNADALVSMRGMQDFIFDMVDVPEKVERAMQSVRQLYAPIYNAIYEAGDMEGKGTTSWSSFYSTKRFNMIQCDLICNISPDMFRRFILPVLEEEANFLDHSIFHLDGVGALVHLDDLLSIDALDGIQWVPGTGNKPMVEWPEVLQKIQARGKCLHIYGTPEEVKRIHRVLRPEGVYYDTHCISEKEAENLISWFKNNT